jgi:hypothetical protein
LTIHRFDKLRELKTLMKPVIPKISTLQKSLNRHVKRDRGDVDDDDKQTNDQALKQGTRLLSAYNDDRFPKNGVATIWIITEGDKSATTILFPDEY